MKSNYDVYLCREKQEIINKYQKQIHDMLNKRSHTEWLAGQMAACHPLDFSERNRENMMNSVNLSYELIKLPDKAERARAEEISYLDLEWWARMSVAAVVVTLVVVAWILAFK